MCRGRKMQLCSGYRNVLVQGMQECCCGGATGMRCAGVRRVQSAVFAGMHSVGFGERGVLGFYEWGLRFTAVSDFVGMQSTGLTAMQAASCAAVSSKLRCVWGMETCWLGLQSQIVVQYLKGWSFQRLNAWELLVYRLPSLTTLEALSLIIHHSSAFTGPLLLKKLPRAPTGSL